MLLPSARFLGAVKASAVLSLVIGYILLFRHFATIHPLDWAQRHANFTSEEQRSFLEFTNDKNLSTRLVAELPTKQVPAHEQYRFGFIKAVCPWARWVHGSDSKFLVCLQRDWPLQRPIYLIGPRDTTLERSFRKRVTPDGPIKVFYFDDDDDDNGDDDDGKNTTAIIRCKDEKGSLSYRKKHRHLFSSGVATYVEFLRVLPLTDPKAQPWELGIHDLLDNYGDLFSIDVIKLVAKDVGDPVIFAILRHAIPQFLLQLRKCDYAALRYLVKRFTYNMYFPLHIRTPCAAKRRDEQQCDDDQHQCLITFVHKFFIQPYDVKLRKAVFFAF